jgi:hypothetical protein
MSAQRMAMSTSTTPNKLRSPGGSVVSATAVNNALLEAQPRHHDPPSKDRVRSGDDSCKVVGQQSHEQILRSRSSLLVVLSDNDQDNIVSHMTAKSGTF